MTWVAKDYYYPMLTTVSKEKWEAYEAVRKSGATNMFDINTVVELSVGILSREDCRLIMKNYKELSEVHSTN